VLSLVIWAVLIFVIVRMGLLASVVTFLCSNLLVRLPYAADFSMWYAWQAITVVLMVVGLVLYGFYISLAGRSVFRFELMEDHQPPSR
jgi:hypothetical protein